MCKFSLLILLCTLTLSLPAQVNRSDEKRAIREVRQHSNDAYQKYDLEGTMACWHPDVVILTGRGTLLDSAEAVKEYLKDIYLKNFDVYFIRITKKLKLSEDGTKAWESGKWISKQHYSEETYPYQGRYVAIWEKREGAWKLKAQTFLSM